MLDQRGHVAVLDAGDGGGDFLPLALGDMLGGLWVGAVVDEQLRRDGARLLAGRLRAAYPTLTASVRANF